MPAHKSKSNNTSILFHVVFGIFALFIIVLSAYNLYLSTKPKAIINIDILDESQKSFWQGMIMKYPTYRDGYIELAKIAINDGDYELSETLLTKAQTIDPFSTEVINLKRVLGAKNY